MKPIRVEAGRQPSDFNQMPEDSPTLVRILDNGNNLHLSTAIRANQRINLVYLHKEAGPSLSISKNIEFNLIL